MRCFNTSISPTQGFNVMIDSNTMCSNRVLGYVHIKPPTLQTCHLATGYNRFLSIPRIKVAIHLIFIKRKKKQRWRMQGFQFPY